MSTTERPTSFDDLCAGVKAGTKRGQANGVDLTPIKDECLLVEVALRSARGST